MAKIKHSLIPAGERHSPFNWIVADAAAKNAITGVTTNDLNKTLLQQDTGVVYRLSVADPITWVALADQLNTINTATQSALDAKLDDTDVGVTVQPYNANTVVDASYVHTDNNYTTTEKNKLAGIAEGAEANQNAFSSVVVSGQTTIEADTKTDTLTLAAGTGVTLTTDAVNDSVTITNSAPNVTTNISITHNTSDIIVNSSDGTDGTINAATSSLAGVMSSSDKTKLNGIEAGAQVNTVTSVAGMTGAVTLTKTDVGLGNVTNDAQLKVASNLSDLNSAAAARTNLGLGTAATKNVPATGDASTTEVVLGTDTRLSNSRTPLSHAHGNITNDGKIGTTASLPVITTTGGTLTTGSFGTAAGTFAQGNDSRLSNAREWTATTIDQTEAETGTATTRRAWTAQRVRQAIVVWWNTVVGTVVQQSDIGTAPNEIPLNQHLGEVAYMNKNNFVISPVASAVPAGVGDMTFQLTSNTSLTVKVKGSDGVVRSVTLTLA